MSDRDLPEDLIGLAVNDGTFICTPCIGEDENVDDETKYTAVFNYDEWFTGDSCARCKKIVLGFEARQ